MSVACLSCRSRKIKCDGRKPRCFNCELYKDDCKFVFHNDKRKPYPKEYIMALKTRIGMLEERLRAAGVEVESLKDDNDDEAILHVVEDSDGTESDEFLNELSNRMGKLSVTKKGLRYFGATSNLNLLTNTLATNDLSEDEDLLERGRHAIEHAGFLVEVPVEVEEHLLELYWTWHHPFFNLLEPSLFLRDRALFNADQENQDIKYYSPLLMNAIMAVSALLDDTLKPMYKDQFHKKAKILLDLEIDSPKITTVQAAAVLGSHEAVCDRDTRGWLYEGMANRMIIELGYHLDATEWIKKGLITEEEAHVRKVTFWGCCLFDRLWSFYMGRPASMRLKDVTVDRPAEKDVRLGDLDKWIPYTEPGAPVAEIWNNFTAPKYLNITRIYLIKLIEMIAEIQETMYSGNTNQLELITFTSRMYVKLTSWYTELPSVLLCSTSNHSSSTSKPVLPHIVVLHMQYYAALILLHRPFINHKKYPTFRTICFESADHITNLTEKYQKYWYSMRRVNVIPVHIIFTAGIVHLLILRNSGLDGQAEGLDKVKASRGLKICFDSLKEMSGAYKTAVRTMRGLEELKKGKKMEMMEYIL